jgi:pyruvate/2-oxoglutarate/acetoin dehydrogenase E1 component
MREITIRDAIREAIDEEMARDEKVILIGEDIGWFGGAFKVTKGLYEKYDEKRFWDTPISEAAIIGTALGAAICNWRPVAEIMFCDFMYCAMDQLVNQVAMVRYMSGGQVTVPMVIRTTAGAGMSTAAQHSQSNEGYFVHTPGLLVVAPSTPYDAKGLLKSAIRENNPVIFYENKNLYNLKGPVPEAEYVIPLGSAEIKRNGKDVTVVTSMEVVHKAISAAHELANEGIDVEVIDLRSLVPLDKSMIINSIRKTHRLIIAMEETKRAGVAAEISSVICEEAFNELRSPIVRVCSFDVPKPFSPPLEKYVMPQIATIIAAVKKVME